MGKLEEYRKEKSDQHRKSNISNKTKESNHIRLIIKKKILEYEKELREQENQE